MLTPEGTEATLVILAALTAVMALCLLALLAAGPIMRLVGAKAEAVVTRLLGVLLAALAAQYVIDGLRAVMAGDSWQVPAGAVQLKALAQPRRTAALLPFEMLGKTPFTRLGTRRQPPCRRKGLVVMVRGVCVIPQGQARMALT